MTGRRAMHLAQLLQVGLRGASVDARPPEAVPESDGSSRARVSTIGAGAAAGAVAVGAVVAARRKYRA